MLILAVDTSTRSGSLALLRDQLVLGQSIISSEMPYSATFSSGIDHLLRGLGFQLGDIELFAVAAGPGSFTGLRIGLTAVKAWSEVFGKPVAAVSGLEAIAAQASLLPDPSQPILFAPVLDARRGQVFGGIYRRGKESGELVPAVPEVVTGVGEFVALVRQQLLGGEVLVFPSPTPDVVRPALERSTLPSNTLEQVSGVLAPFIGQLGYAKALRGDLVDGLRLDANYVRRTDAESKWKDS